MYRKADKEGDVELRDAGCEAVFGDVEGAGYAAGGLGYHLWKQVSILFLVLLLSPKFCSSISTIVVYTSRHKTADLGSKDIQYPFTDSSAVLS